MKDVHLAFRWMYIYINSSRINLQCNVNERVGSSRKKAVVNILDRLLDIARLYETTCCISLQGKKRLWFITVNEKNKIHLLDMIICVSDQTSSSKLQVSILSLEGQQLIRNTVSINQPYVINSAIFGCGRNAQCFVALTLASEGNALRMYGVLIQDVNNARILFIGFI